MRRYNLNLNNSNLPIQLFEMLSKHGKDLFKKLSIEITSELDLVAGVKLAQAINKIFYDGNNDGFANKIIKNNLQRKGNHIINANNILKQIKNDENIQCPSEIRGMTSFTMIQNQGQLQKFIDWLARQYDIKSTSNNIIYEETEPNEQDKYNGHQSYLLDKAQMSGNISEMAKENEGSQFQNVFFCHKDLSPNGVETPPLDDNHNDSDKVVKKGSFKIIRPKEQFDHKISGVTDQPQGQALMLKQRVIVDDTSEENEPSARKTVPKIADRPPLYRKLKRQTTKAQSRVPKEDRIYLSPAPFNQDNIDKIQEQIPKNAQKSGHQNSYLNMKNDSLNDDINELQEEIQRQTRSIEVNRSRKTNRSQSSAQRKLFKMDIPEVALEQKKQIVYWLIDINLLNSVAASYFDRLHEICKNGVIFPEIINHQKGRGSDLCYFKKPKRAAQIHSNYQKVFNYLKEIPLFQSQLLYMYEYFVPETQEAAFWSLLWSCKNCFQKAYKRNKSKKEQKQQLYTRESSIKAKMSRTNILSSEKKNTDNKNKLQSAKKASDTLQYQRIKYGTSAQFKRSSSQQKKDSRKSSLEFIKEIPDKKYSKKEELVQRQEPVQLTNKANLGYKQLHEYKKNQSLTNSNLKTPQKHNISLNNDCSMSRSRVQTNSVKKLIKMQNPQLPTVTLQMQMKSIKFLKQNNYLPDEDEDFDSQKSLFHDPVRNGTLLNLIFKKQMMHESHRYFIRPKNIVDCRSNFDKFFNGIRIVGINVPRTYEYYYEEIIRGQLSLFYGIIWHLFYNNRAVNGQTISNVLPESQMNESLIMWIQTLEKHSQNIAKLQIRDILALYSAINNSNLLYKIAEVVMPEKYTLRPTYQKPLNHIEQESNLKKIISFYVHQRIIKSDYNWKLRSIVKKDKTVITHLLNDLRKYHMKMKNRNMEGTNSLAKYVKYDRTQSQPLERLQTTLGGQSFSQQSHQNAEKDQPHKKNAQEKEKSDKNTMIQVEWMRKLGYCGDLSLNNGVILCRLISQLTMKSIKFNENPQSKAECLINIRKAIKQIDKFKWDEQDICSADPKMTYTIYTCLKDKYKHSYALRCLH